MNKKSMIILGVVAFIAILGGGLAYANSQNVKKEADKMAMEKAASEKDAMAKELAMKKEDTVAKTSDTIKKDEAVTKAGAYVTLADYNANPAKYADSKKVYFFHASWCPICQGIEKEINADITRIPQGVTLIKTDFDNSTQLRQKYGVTTQSTFVQVGSNGDEKAQWTASNLDKVIAGIKA